VRGRGIESAPVSQPSEFTIDASNALFAANPLVFITGLCDILYCCCYNYNNNNNYYYYYYYYC